MPNRCTHERSPLASCRSCVDICPQEAWQLRGNDLVLNESQCAQCGLCVMACPEGALTAAFSAPLIDLPAHTAFLACEVGVDDGGEGVLPCVHAVSDHALMSLSQHGVRQIKMVRGDCSHCTCLPDPEHTVEHRLANLNAALLAREIPAMTIESGDVSTWSAQVDRLQGITKRRQFFGNLMRRPATILFDQPAEGNDVKAVGTFLQKKGPGPLPAVPIIDLNHCSFCRACEVLCAHQVISFHESGEKASFEINPERCTGCGLCADVCLDKAITIQTWHTATHSSDAMLVRQECTRCRHDYWQPDQERKTSICPVCQQSGGKLPNRLVES